MSENASRHFRQILLLSFGYNFGIAILLGAIFILPPYDEFKREYVIAIPSLIFIVIAIICTHIFTIESPIFLLQQQKIVYEEDLSEAYDTFTSLQKKEILPEEIERKFDEIKAMLADELPLTCNVFSDDNAKPLLLCICLRLVSLFSFNLPLIMSIIEITSNEILIPCKLKHDNARILVNILFWFIGGMTTICIVHYLNKKYIFYLFSTMFGISYTFIRILFIFDVRYSLVFYFPAVLLLFYFYIVSLPLDMISNVYLSEAFATPKKPLSIGLITVIEHFVHILLLLMHFNRFIECFWLIISLSLMGLSFKVYWSLPHDTNGKSLQQCYFAFRNATVRECYSQANNNSRRSVI